MFQAEILVLPFDLMKQESHGRSLLDADLDPCVIRGLKMVKIFLKDCSSIEMINNVSNF